MQFDSDGAAFAVVFDNHVQDLEMDLPAEAELTVDRTVWPAPGTGQATPRGPSP